MEIWKTIIEFKDYQVSNLGRIKSKERIYWMKVNNCFAISKERILKHGYDKNGYCLVVLQKNRNRKTRTIHQLVAEAFLNFNQSGHKLVINHINFDKTDNRLENLEAVTQRENANRKHLKSSSKYTGVCFNKINKNWTAQISINRKKIYLGSFINEIEAHNAYLLAKSKLIN